MSSFTRRAPHFLVASTVIGVALLLPAGSSAMLPTPHWVAFSQQAPTEFHSGDTRDFYEIVAVNDGGANTQGSITVTDTLPAGVTVDASNAVAEIAGIQNNQHTNFAPGCEQTSSKGIVTVTCRTSASVPVGRAILVNLNVEVPAVVKPGERLINTTTITGGGAQESETHSSTLVAEPSLPVPFGASLATDLTDAAGISGMQAGSHSFAFTTMLMFNVAGVNPQENCYGGHAPVCPVAPNAQPRDIEVTLPPGFVGNPTAVPHCTQTQFEANKAEGCPPSTQVGMVYVEFYGGGSGAHNQASPVYNIQPPTGEPGELGFTIAHVAHIPLFFHVRSDGDYGVTADLSTINQYIAVRMALMSIWGNPSNEAHDPLRISAFENCNNGCPSGLPSPKPFLRTPTSCPEGSLAIPLAGDSWQNPEPAPFAQLGSSSIAGMTGCGALRFEPSVAVSADARRAGAPAGYKVALQVPQNEEPEGLATPDVRDVEVAMPAGTQVSSSSANGLAACSDTQFGLKVRAAGDCPGASRLGSVKITTPLLASQVKGNLYLGAPECSPCTPADAGNGHMVRMFLEAEAEGVIVKQAGHARINQTTGQVTAVFTDTPQLPFSELEVELEPGENAALANPVTCGPAVANVSLTPWSSSTPTSVQAPPFQIEGNCTPGFSPAFQGGTTPTHAGGFAGFSMTLSHSDNEQALGQVSVATPPGLLGVLKNVEQCPEPQASTGTCGAGSLIGSGSVVVGPGTQPLEIKGSKVYLTGPYAGQPFGLSIVTPTVAGPFVLSGNTGNGTEVVRASIAVDPHTSALTVRSDSLPQALNGVPLDIRLIHIDINHENFTFNPTNCNNLTVAGTITSTTGTAANVSSPFRATGCNQLPFRPTFKVTTEGKTSKKRGASLHVYVTSSRGQANIAKVRVSLPIQLPSRTSTLQKACIDSVFEANPASCSPDSIVGQATAVTPLLKNPLRGPAYLVSHAGRSFPDLEIILQGEGITLVLVGNTDIKKGITTSTFETVPDAPINSFDLNLPEGPHSILAAFGNLCTSKLNMPTVITGQNNGVVKQATRITATGCPKHKAKTTHTRKHR